MLPTDYLFTTQDAGTHTFTGQVQLRVSSSGCYVQVADGTKTGRESGIVVNVAPAEKLGWVVSPSGSQTAGQAWSPDIKIEILDHYNNRTHDSLLITLVASDGSFASGYQVSAVDGLATFSALTYNIAATITVTGTASGLTSTAASSPVTVNPRQFRSFHLAECYGTDRGIGF